MLYWPSCLPRVEYGEKADMADIIGWFGVMGSGSVSAAYE